MKKQVSESKYFALVGIILMTIGALSGMGMLSLSSGEVGKFFGGLLKKGFGISGILLSIYILFLGFAMIIKRERPRFNLYLVGAALIFLDLLAVLHLRLDLISEKLRWQAGLDGNGGGVLGAILSIGLERYFGVVGTYIILVAVLCIGLLFFDLSYRKFFSYCWEFVLDLSVSTKELISGLIVRLLDKFPQKPVNRPEVREQQTIQRPAKTESAQNLVANTVHHIAPVVEETKKEIPVFKEKEREKIIIKTKSTPPPAAAAKQPLRPGDGKFQLPPLDFLRSKSISTKDTAEDTRLAENAKKLEETLDCFGIKAQVIETFRGPMATRYELQLMPGTKVSKIVGLSDDLALALAASEVRIEAPIPGKAAVGIEVPNKEKAIVYLKETLETAEFQKMESKITFGLGKDITGMPVVADLAKMPHLLVAGATGMGKSVFINSLITSILFKATATEVKFIMVDPKMVELAVYNGIPHLLAPVVTEAKKAAAVLRWIVQEMENRYHLFASAGVRNMQGYNELQLKQNTPEEDLKLLPNIVVIIDELADLMMVAARDVEDAICRLAQMARAAGIHLVIATQRPSVDVITGVIKANIPSRIAFAVSSQIDSRTILDMGGAEKLLGKGDMLFFPVGAAKPVRVQGAFISDQEVETLVNILKESAKPDYQNLEVVKGQMTLEDASEEDDLFEKAVQLVIASKQASASFLQRRLRIGYNRAADLIEQMEQKGIVGPATGNSKPREVLIDSPEQLEGIM